MTIVAVGPYRAAIAYLDGLKARTIKRTQMRALLPNGDEVRCVSNAEQLKGLLIGDVVVLSGCSLELEYAAKERMLVTASRV